MKGTEYLIDEKFDTTLTGEDIVSYLLKPNGYESFRVEQLMQNFPLIEETRVTFIKTFSLYPLLFIDPPFINYSSFSKFPGKPALLLYCHGIGTFLW